MTEPPETPSTFASSAEELIDRFYLAFGERDWAGMGACYHDGASFSDPVFPALDAAGARAMWRMLCEAGTDLEIELVDRWVDGERGGATWRARYTFTATGRKVQNEIEASFRFRDGRFVEHHDRFNFWRWSRQALGPIGWLLGWTPLLRRQVQARAGRQLARAREKSASTGG